MRELDQIELDAVVGGHDQDGHTPEEVATENALNSITGDMWHCEDKDPSSGIDMTCTVVKN